MIQINLLPQNSSRGRSSGGQAAVARSGGGMGIVWAMAVLVLLIDGGAGYLAFRQVTQATSKYMTVLSEYDMVKKQVDERMSKAEEVRQFREVVNNQMDVLRSLDPPDRILWSEKLNMLANLMPPNVFISEVEVKEYVTMVETAQSKAARERYKKALANKKENEATPKEPPVVNKPVIHYVMHITGLSLGENNDEQLNNVTKFHKAIINYERVDGKGEKRRFMDGFTSNIEFESIVATEYEGTPVNKFIFKLTTKPMGIEEPKKPAAQTARQVASAAARP